MTDDMMGRHCDFGGGVDMIVTAFSAVRLSAESVAKLDAIDSDWRGLVDSRRRWGAKAEQARQQIQVFFDEVDEKSESAWKAGGTLEVY